MCHTQTSHILNEVCILCASPSLLTMDSMVLGCLQFIFETMHGKTHTALASISHIFGRPQVTAVHSAHRTQRAPCTHLCPTSNLRCLPLSSIYLR